MRANRRSEPTDQREPVSDNHGDAGLNSAPDKSNGNEAAERPASVCGATSASIAGKWLLARLTGRRVGIRRDRSYETYECAKAMLPGWRAQCEACYGHAPDYGTCVAIIAEYVGV